MKNSTSIDFCNGQVGNILFEIVSKDKWQDDSLTMTVRKPGRIGQTDEIQCSISLRELKAAVEIIEKCVNSSNNQIGYSTQVDSGKFGKQEYKPMSVFDLQRELYSAGVEAMKLHDAVLINGNSSTSSSTESAYSAGDGSD